MIDIPASFVITSRLAALDSRDVTRLISLAASQWQEGQIQSRMRHHVSNPIIGIGISNPQELTRAVSSDIPIVHIQNDCKSLQAATRKQVRRRWCHNRIWMLVTCGLWGYSLSKIGKFKLLKRGEDMIEYRVLDKGNITIPRYLIGLGTATLGICLCWITKQVLYNRMRQQEYSCLDKDKEFMLLRNDVLYSPFHYLIQTVVPFCSVAGLTAYFLNRESLI